jgi:hypothetical protein
MPACTGSRAARVTRGVEGGLSGSTHDAAERMKKATRGQGCLETLQRIRILLVATAALPRLGVLPGKRLVRRTSRVTVPPVWVRRSRFAVGHSLGFAVFLSRGGRASLITRHARPSRFVARWSHFQQDLVCRPKPANASHGLLLPAAHEVTAVHLTRACQPATFRLQGLITLLTACSRRDRAGLFSYQQRSWDSPFGAFPSHEVPAAFANGWTHMPFLSAVLPPPEGDGPAQLSRGFWASTLARVPGGETGFNAFATGGSLGFCPLRVHSQRPGSRFRSNSSHALQSHSGEPSHSGAPEYQSAVTWHDPPQRLVRPFRVSHQFAPAHSSVAGSGLCVHLVLRPTSLPPANTLWNLITRSTGVVRASS